VSFTIDWSAVVLLGTALIAIVAVGIARSDQDGRPS